MRIGPVPALVWLFARMGLDWDDIDLEELHEAFALQVMAVLKGWRWDNRDKLKCKWVMDFTRPTCWCNLCTYAR